MKQFLLSAFLAVLAILGGPSASHAQQLQAFVVSSCGSPSITYVAGNLGILTMDTTGKVCDGASGGGSTTANQGNKGTNAQAWWVEIGDGTNGPAAVKAASTAPAAADPALVVGISPNSYGDPCSGAVAKSSIAIALTATGTLQLLALSGTTVIYVCGFVATIPNTATTATSLKFIAGTGTNCGTPTATLTGPMGSNDPAAVSANPVVVAYGGANATAFPTPSGSELCTVVTGNGTLDISGVLSYVQK